ncbi:MAG TPA: hypothetical protein VGP06_02445 [Janthinobacterium sp.]|jgi:hypothetical protein|nr:hypothetical protein [Janthinobacterium sp.]
MKSLYARSLVALLCCASLAACGGSSGTLALSGTITGLNKSGLVLENVKTGDTVSPASGDISFTFPTLLNEDDYFQVIVKTQPTGGSCSFVGTLATTDGTSASSNASVYTVSNLAITCAATPHTLGGTITGPHPLGLILINGSDQLAPTADATTFTFAGSVGDGSAYGVTVFQQPPGHTCTVANGVGTLGSVNVDNVQVTCI